MQHAECQQLLAVTLLSCMILPELNLVLLLAVLEVSACRSVACWPTPRLQHMESQHLLAMAELRDSCLNCNNYHSYFDWAGAYAGLWPTSQPLASVHVVCWYQPQALICVHCCLLHWTCVGLWAVNQPLAAAHGVPALESKSK